MYLYFIIEIIEKKKSHDNLGPQLFSVLKGNDFILKYHHGIAQHQDFNSG